MLIRGIYLVLTGVNYVAAKDLRAQYSSGESIITLPEVRIVNAALVLSVCGLVSGKWWFLVPAAVPASLAGLGYSILALGLDI